MAAVISAVHVGQPVKIKHSKKTISEEDLERKNHRLSLKNIDLSTISSFSDYPLSVKTQKGLLDAGFSTPTEIQKQGIIIALQSCDILGAAKTGSGKTLAFIIPLIEILWHEKWSDVHGLGALVISPTRELALQIYDVLRKVGKYHDFSAGLIIGGKDLKEEQERILNMNIIICTPGRILQHFDETPSFSCFDLKLLVFDEADRILDLGFSRAINAIIENLPEKRQTLLYSATQTKSVKDLSRVSLTNPEYIAVHESAKYKTPKKLIQNYVSLELSGKINFLFSFIKNHLKAKCIVFLSSCKEVKFLYEVFRKLRPGIPLMALYGKQKQLKRVLIYNRFCNIKNAVLFATDIAARGLDFLAVHWVIQYDCPEDPDLYIHRVGRTARYEKGGHALLMLIPSEKDMVKKLTDNKIPIHELQCNPKKITSIQRKIQALCVQDQHIKELAQKSISSYVRSVFLQGDKSVFDVNKLPLEEFSHSYGLMKTPTLNFLSKMPKTMGPVVQADNVKKNKDFSFDVSDDEDTEVSDVLIRKISSYIDNEIPAIAIDEFNVKKKHISKSSLAKKIIKKKINVSSKIVFDENGENASCDQSLEDDSLISSSGINIDQAKMYIKQQDKIDNMKEKGRIKQKHKDAKEKKKLKRKIIINVDEGILSDDDDICEKRIKSESTQDNSDFDQPRTLEEDEGLALHYLK